MELEQFFRSVLEQDRAPVVLCDLQHTIIYINRSAAGSYAKWGGYALVGKSLLECHTAPSSERIKEVVAWFAADVGNNIVHTFRNEEENKDVYMVALRDEGGALIGYYEKHEYRTPESAGLYDMR